MADKFDPFKIHTKRFKHWGWTYTLIFLILLLIVGALTFYVLSLLVTDEDLYYKKKKFDHEYTRSTLSKEFLSIEVVGEILPHFILADENDKFLPLEFINKTYFKNMTFDNGEAPKLARFEELYHYTEDTKDDLPHFTYNGMYIPYGDSKSSCLHIRYRSKTKPVTNYENFDHLLNMPQGLGKKESLWSKDDPSDGVNLLVWKEFANEHKGDGRNGIFKLNTCYEYVILEKIGLIIRPHQKDPSLGWEYSEGCYEGSAVKYKKAVPGETYTFDNVPIEIRIHKTPFYEFENNNAVLGADLSYFGWLSRMCWILVLICFTSLLIFTCYRLCVPPKPHEEGF